MQTPSFKTCPSCQQRTAMHLAICPRCGRPFHTTAPMPDPTIYSPAPPPVIGYAPSAPTPPPMLDHALRVLTMTTMVLVSICCLLYIDTWIEGKLAVVWAQEQIQRMQQQQRQSYPYSSGNGM